MKPIIIDVGDAEQTYIFKTGRGEITVTVNVNEDFFSGAAGGNYYSAMCDKVAATPEIVSSKARAFYNRLLYLVETGVKKEEEENNAVL